jgi:hypothetical protein
MGENDNDEDEDDNDEGNAIAPLAPAPTPAACLRRSSKKKPLWRWFLSKSPCGA